MSIAQIEPTAAAPPGGGLLAITNIEQAINVIGQINDTDFVPRQYRGKPEQILACFLYGSELGLGLMQSLNSIDIVQGTVFLRAQLVQALARSVGGSIDVEEATAEKASVLAKRPGWSQPRRVEFTIEEAQRQGLAGKDQWKKDPMGMLVNRATTRAGRWYFSDVLKGIYVEGEDHDTTVPAGEVETKPVETIAELAQRRTEQLPRGAAVASKVPLGQEANVVDVPLPLAGSEEGDDYLAWDKAQWSRACVDGKLSLIDLRQGWNLRNYDALVAAEPEVKTDVYKALVGGSKPAGPTADRPIEDDEAPF